MVADTPDFTNNINIVGTQVTLNVNISASSATVNVNLSSQSVTLNVNLTSQSVTLNVNISSQTGNLNININASAVNVGILFEGQAAGVFNGAEYGSQTGNGSFTSGTATIAQATQTTIVSGTNSSGKNYWVTGITVGQIQTAADYDITVFFYINGALQDTISSPAGGDFLFQAPFVINNTVSYRLDIEFTSATIHNETVYAALIGYLR